jgi:hypothetical protein
MKSKEKFAMSMKQIRAVCKWVSELKLPDGYASNMHRCVDKGKGKIKEISIKRLIYLPLIPRLKRLYASMRSAPHMRWHFENQRESRVLCDPSDGEAEKHYDETYPECKAEPRNVRLGQCADSIYSIINSLPLLTCDYHSL